MRSWIGCRFISRPCVKRRARPAALQARAACVLLVAAGSLQGQQAAEPVRGEPPPGSVNEAVGVATPGAPPALQAVPDQRPADARELLAAFAKLQGMEASFVETKHLALLAVPLQSAGRFYFSAPGYLLRVVQTPEPSRLLIEPGQLSMTNRDGTETIDLRQSDGLRLFVTSLVRVFSGDEKALAEHYTMAFAAPPDTDGWTLSLTPKAAPLTQMIRELSLSGTGFATHTIVVKEPNGDRSVTTLAEVDVARVFSAEERHELFGIAPR